MTIEESIRTKVQTQLQPVYLHLENDSHQHAGPGSQTHFSLVVVAQIFEGKSRIERQRLINDLFPEERQQGLHALTMRTFTPGEWDKVKADFEMQSPPCHGGSKK